MANEGNPGINKLANALTSRMKVENESPLVLDFGSINANYSLQTNTFPVPIPQSDYTVCRQLTLGNTGSKLTTTSENGSHNHGGGSHSHSGGSHSGHTDGDGTHSHSGGDHAHAAAGSHAHDVYVPEKMRSLKPGDRVLVAWVQSDAVVIDIILPASSI